MFSITGMSVSEIASAQAEISQGLSPSTIAMLKKRAQGKSNTSTGTSVSDANPPTHAAPTPASTTATSQTDFQLPFKVDPEWVHMDVLEPEKLAWIKDLPEQPATNDTSQSRIQAFKNFQVYWNVGVFCKV